MPYTPPSQRSPAASSSSSPNLSRRGSYGPSHGVPMPASNRPDLPRSTSYLTRHRRTPSVKTTTFAPPDTSEPTPPGTADRDTNEANALTINGSLRQSPPPVSDETQMPPGAVLSPPESTNNSSDDEGAEKKDRGRQLENLAELQAAIRIISQRRESSPNRQAADVGRATQALKLLMPDEKLELSSTTDHIERVLSDSARKIGHSRSNTDVGASSSVFIGLRQADSDTPPSGSEEEDSDDDESGRSRRKPPMLRKKSGELVRPALRPSSSRRRPSSMPGTPTFSKAVHFDAHLEHVRHFLQVDRPLAVSAGSSPVESYDSDNEFPFGEDEHHRSPPFEWEIVVSNFPAETPRRLALPVRVERVYLSTDNKTLIGSVAVANLAYSKYVIARFTLDYWKTTSEVVAEFNNDVRRKPEQDGYDRFNFNIKLADQANLEAKTMFFCVKYGVNGVEYWDNNNNTNFQVDFRKKPKPQNGKRGMPGAASRPANGLPRSAKKSLSGPSVKPRAIVPTFDDFADGFDASSKYDFKNFAQPSTDFLGVSGDSSSLRLKGVKSAVSLGVAENLGRRSQNPSGQAFSNRYDFGASLSAAIQAANVALGDRSGITMKPAKKPVKTLPAPAPATTVAKPTTEAPVQVASPAIPAKGTDSPRPVGTEKPVLASQSYNELLDKYCFFGSARGSPQMKDGTLGARPGQFDGGDDNYSQGSQSPSPVSNGSPMQPQFSSRPSPPRMESGGGKDRSTSPAPMTGFATGTSPMYPYSRPVGFQFAFNEAHTATAIRG